MTDRPPVLYVDDEESALVIFEAAFDDDFDLHLTTSAREALEIVRRVPIQLVVADQRMPRTTGVQLLEVVQTERPDAIRMILTGYSEIDTIIQAINTRRIHHYATKPWKPKELRVTLDHALETYELHRHRRSLEEQLKQKVAREREIRRAFQRFAPAAVVDALFDDREVLAESRIVAALYFDVHGFDELSARLPAEQVVAFLNSFFRVMHEAVVRHRGTVIGPRLAVFGAPISSLTNAENALEAALGLLRALEDFNRRQAVALLGEPISLAACVHLGEVVTGNVGSAEKMEYSVIGEAVDVAMALWRLTEADRQTILITDAVREPTRHLADARELGPATLRGGAEPITVYEVLVPAAIASAEPPVLSHA